MELAVAFTWATPLEPIVAEVLERLAEAPLGGRETHQAPSDRLARPVGGDADGQRISEGRAGYLRLRRAPGHGRDGESTGLEGTDVGLWRVEWIAASLPS